MVRRADMTPLTTIRITWRLVQVACGRAPKHVIGTADPVKRNDPSTPVNAEAIPY